MERMEAIEKLAKNHAGAGEVLAGRVMNLKNELESAQRRLLPGIKFAVAKAKESRSKLEAEITAHPEIFDKPKTRIFHGIKCGFKKGGGKVGWSDKDSVVKLIRTHFKARFDELVKTAYAPIKEALKKLNVAELKRIGCTLTGTGDTVLADAVDSGVDKLMAALLKEAPEDGEGGG